MYQVTIPTFGDAESIKKAKEKVIKIFGRCGFKYTDYHGTTYGTQLALPRLRMPGVYHNDTLYIANCLMNKLYTEGWNDEELFPFEDITVGVNCMNKRHRVLVTKTGKIVLLDHKKEEEETDIALNVIAGRPSLPRCLNIRHRWMNAVKDSSYNTEDIPADLKSRFRSCWLKSYNRKKIHAYQNLHEDLFATKREDRLQRVITRHKTITGRPVPLSMVNAAYRYLNKHEQERTQATGDQQ